jgi:multicomponent Na+:H+ antiporter subunit F
MSTAFLLAVVAMLLLAVPYLVRVAAGPTVFDRVVALNGVGTKVPALVVLVGLLYDRVDMFVDIALSLFLLNLVLTLLLARYVREKGSAT